MTHKLTPRQNEIYQFIVASIRQNAYSPTVREIADEFGIRSPNGVAVNLTALEKKGVITRKPGKSRNIQIVGGVVGERCPLCGGIKKEEKR